MVHFIMYTTVVLAIVLNEPNASKMNFQLSAIHGVRWSVNAWVWESETCVVRVDKHVLETREWSFFKTNYRQDHEKNEK